MLDDNVPQPWQGQTTLVFALAASSLGLGNVLRMPYLMGEHGGAPFFMGYAFAVFAVAVPILTAEVMVGSKGRGSPVGALRWAADQSGRSSHWSLLGLIQCLLGLLLAVYCLVLATWMLDRAMVLNQDSLAAASASEIAVDFLVHVNNSSYVVPIGLLGTVTVLAALGPRVGMGLMGWVALPAMAVALGSVLQFAMKFGDLQAAEDWLFRVNYQDLGWQGALAGLTSGSLTLVAGLGVGSVFGARTPKSLPLFRAVLAAGVLDVAFMLTTAMALVPLLGAVNTLPAEGLAFIFVAVPYAFANLPLGEVYGAVFFGFAALASLTAVLALVEPAVMFLHLELSLNRNGSALIVGILVGVGALLLHFWGGISAALSGLLDRAIVLSLLLLAVFVAWRMPRPLARGELYREPRWLFDIWWLCLRILAPSVLLLILFGRFGLPAANG